MEPLPSGLEECVPGRVVGILRLLEHDRRRQARGRIPALLRHVAEREGRRQPAGAVIPALNGWTVWHRRQGNVAAPVVKNVCVEAWPDSACQLVYPELLRAVAPALRVIGCGLHAAQERRCRLDRHAAGCQCRTIAVIETRHQWAVKVVVGDPGEGAVHVACLNRLHARLRRHAAVAPVVRRKRDPRRVCHAGHRTGKLHDPRQVAITDAAVVVVIGCHLNEVARTGGIGGRPGKPVGGGVVRAHPRSRQARQAVVDAPRDRACWRLHAAYQSLIVVGVAGPQKMDALGAERRRGRVGETADIEVAVDGDHLPRRIEG